MESAIERGEYSDQNCSCGYGNRCRCSPVYTPCLTHGPVNRVSGESPASVPHTGIDIDRSSFSFEHTNVRRCRPNQWGMAPVVQWYGMCAAAIKNHNVLGSTPNAIPT